MSSYMVSNDLVDLIVSLGMQGGWENRPHIAVTVEGYERIYTLGTEFELAGRVPAGSDELVSGTQVGKVLLLANLSAMVCRYGDRIPDTEFSGYAAQVDRYQFRAVPIHALPGEEAAALASLATYEYQADESNDWDDSEAAQWCTQLRAMGVQQLVSRISEETGYDGCTFTRDDLNTIRR